MDILTFVEEYKIGDFSSLLGLVVAVIGFGYTLWQVRNARTAAEEAKKAAAETRDIVARFDTISRMAAAIHILEEIMRLHRLKAWPIVVDRYSVVRRELSMILHKNPGFLEDHRKSLSLAISNVRTIHKSVEKWIEDPNQTGPDSSELNEKIAKQIERLTEIYASLFPEVIQDVQRNS